MKHEKSSQLEPTGTAPLVSLGDCSLKRTVTVIGGGTGSFHVLTGLRPCKDLHVQSIVTMMDSGGDSGRLRDEFGVLPPGDVRRCLVALSEESQLMRDLFTFRFSEPPLDGRSIGNLLFLALAKILQSEEGAIEALGRLLKIRGRVMAVTLDHSHLCCRLADGTTLCTEAAIDIPKHDPSIPIREVFLEPEARANPQAVQAIAESDFVVLAPGNLYTSTVPNLLVKGIPEALQKAKAPLVYIVNLMTVYGETQGYDASRHVAEISRYAGRTVDAILAHQGSVPSRLASRYKAEAAEPVQIDLETLRQQGVKTIHQADLMSAASLVRHDPGRTASALMALFGELTSRS